jgi:hypothetical protein
MTRAARLAPIFITFAAVSAHADEVQTTTAGTVVIVAPSAPVVVPTTPVAAPGAVAAVSPVPAPNAPPQNEDWSNVSHINGTPVPVGERNKYLYRFRKTQVTVNPFSPFFGYYDIGAAHALSQNVAVQGSLTMWDYSHGDHTGYQLTASVPLYLKRTFSGPFLEPGLIVRESNSGSSYCYDANGSYSSCGTDTHRWAGPEMLFGWQATFDSGFTVQWAFGVAKRMATNYGSSGDDTDVNGYFRVGYAF